MTLYTENEILSRAEEGGYAVGAFFVLSMDWINPIFEAAEEEGAPVIISNSPGEVEKIGFGTYSAALMEAAHNARVPVCLHMDHGMTTDERTLGDIMKFVRNGWSSVMYDGSMMPIEENTQRTKDIVKMCHAGEITVLGAMGKVPRDVKEVEGYEVPQSILTKPGEAREFVEETGVDSLAIAIGQFVHPLTLGESRPIQKTAKIDLDLLKQIRSATDAHLVLHGGTHISDEDVKKTIELGVSEIKVAASLAIAWVDALDGYRRDNPDDLMPSNIVKAASKEIKKLTVEYIRLFGSAGKA